jgi:hypothetical protein
VGRLKLRGLGYYGPDMKPLPAPDVPGRTEAERMDNAVRKMFSVSKGDILKREQEWKQEREKAKKKPKKKVH